LKFIFYLFALLGCVAVLALPLDLVVDELADELDGPTQQSTLAENAAVMVAMQLLSHSKNDATLPIDDVTAFVVALYIGRISMIYSFFTFWADHVPQGDAAHCLQLRLSVSNLRLLWGNQTLISPCQIHSSDGKFV
jgi:hypothetical protein